MLMRGPPRAEKCPGQDNSIGLSPGYEQGIGLFLPHAPCSQRNDKPVREALTLGLRWKRYGNARRRVRVSAGPRQLPLERGVLKDGA